MFVDRSEIPQRPDVNRDVSKILVTAHQKISGSPVMFLPQRAAISQLGGFIRGLQFPCSGGCVFSGSRRHQLARYGFCPGSKSGLSVQ